jgi:membrane associated rhomboid family serine protease
VFPLRDNIPTDHFPVVTVILIALNCIAYFFLQPKTGIDFNGAGLNQQDLMHYGFIPYEITHPGQHCELIQSTQVACGKGVSDPIPTWLTPFTAMFTHAGLLHLGGNMLFLWIFGNNVEDAMGPVRFVIFYLLAGLAATGLQLVFGPDSVTPNLGASGAIAGVLGAYFVLLPRARVLTWIVFVLREIPAFWFLGFWIAYQAYFGQFALTHPEAGGGVAFFAHIGGFAFGAVTVKLVQKRRPLQPVY